MTKLRQVFVSLTIGLHVLERDARDKSFHSVLVNQFEARKHLEDRALLAAAADLRLNHSVVVREDMLTVGGDLELRRCHRDCELEFTVELEREDIRPLFIFIPSKKNVFAN